MLYLGITLISWCVGMQIKQLWSQRGFYKSFKGKSERSDSMVGLESVKASPKETVYEFGRMKVNL